MISERELDVGFHRGPRAISLRHLGLAAAAPGLQDRGVPPAAAEAGGFGAPADLSRPRQVPVGVEVDGDLLSLALWDRCTPPRLCTSAHRAWPLLPPSGAAIAPALHRYCTTDRPGRTGQRSIHSSNGTMSPRSSRQALTSCPCARRPTSQDVFSHCIDSVMRRGSPCSTRIAAPSSHKNDIGWVATQRAPDSGICTRSPAGGAVTVLVLGSGPAGRAPLVVVTLVVRTPVLVFDGNGLPGVDALATGRSVVGVRWDPLILVHCLLLSLPAPVIGALCSYSSTARGCRTGHHASSSRFLGTISVSPRSGQKTSQKPLLIAPPGAVAADRPTLPRVTSPMVPFLISNVW